MYFAKNGLSRYSFNEHALHFSKYFRDQDFAVQARPATHGSASLEPRASDLPQWLPAGILMTILAGFLAGAIIWPAQAKADTIFVREPITESGITGDEAQAAKALIRSAVANRSGDQLVSNESTSRIQLQPRLLRLGDVFLLTLEKSVHGETVYVSQTKFPRITELDMAARRTVSNVLAEPLASYKKNGTPRYPSAPYSDSKIAGQQKPNPYGDRPAQDNTNGKNPNEAAVVATGLTPPTQSASPSGTQSNIESKTPPNQYGADNAGGVSNDSNQQPQATGAAANDGRGSRPLKKAADPEDVNRSSRQLHDITSQFPDRPTNRWLVGIGPMVSRHMASDQVMYGLAGAYVWDMNPFLSTKVMLEANLTGGGDGAQYYNGAIGGNYYFVNRIENAPYVTADVGYGYASSLSDGNAEGFSLGLGAGYELLRTSTNPLDLSLRFSTIFQGMSKGYGDPSIIGARISVSI